MLSKSELLLLRMTRKMMKMPIMMVTMITGMNFLMPVLKKRAILEYENAWKNALYLLPCRPIWSKVFLRKFPPPT